MKPRVAPPSYLRSSSFSWKGRGWRVLAPNTSTGVQQQFIDTSIQKYYFGVKFNQKESSILSVSTIYFLSFPLFYFFGVSIKHLIPQFLLEGYKLGGGGEHFVFCRSHRTVYIVYIHICSLTFKLQVDLKSWKYVGNIKQKLQDTQLIYLHLVQSTCLL